MQIKLTENNMRFIVEKTLYKILNEAIQEDKDRHYVKKVLFYPYEALFDEISDQEISEMEDAGIKEHYTVWINRYFEADTYNTPGGDWVEKYQVDDLQNDLQKLRDKSLSDKIWMALEGFVEEDDGLSPIDQINQENDF